MNLELEKKSVNAIRVLAADAVQKANSGHPGLPLSLIHILILIITRKICIVNNIQIV